MSGPLLTPQQQIEYLKSRGVKFDLYCTIDALSYLRTNTNFFRLKSYKAGFEQVVGGPNDGQYINLDFAMLVDLSIIDMLLRNELLPMTLDIEHFAKMRLMSAIETHGDDGYKLVSKFIQESWNPKTKRNQVLDEIARGKSSPYVSSIVAEHPSHDYPIWEFVEIVPFGTFLRLYRFCAMKFNDRRMINDYYCMQSVKGMRNGCAHNNCIINNMRRDATPRRPQNAVIQALAQIGVSGDMRRTKLGNERLQQVATTFYMHQLWASPGIVKHRAMSLWVFAERMFKHIDYYDHNDQVSTGFAFIEKMIDGWYPKQLFGE